MGLIATDSGTKFTPAPAGTHPAICVQIIDIGHQFSQFYGKTKHKVIIGWEIPDEIAEDGKPFMVWGRYTLSLHENAGLRAMLESWRGKPFSSDEVKGFPLTGLLGKPCLLSVIHKEDGGKTFANVKTVMALPKGTPAPKRTREDLVFDVDKFDQKVYDTFGENLKKTIDASDERKAATKKGVNHDKPFDVPGAAAEASESADDIPF